MPLAIRAGRLIDGTGAAPVPHALILVEDDRFTVVAREEEGAIPAGFDVVDASAHTVIPGMIDAHVHIRGSGDPGDRGFGESDSIPTLTLKCLRNAVRSLEAGFTTLRDAACAHYADIAVRDAIHRGELVGPRLWCCGLGITSTSGHMDREKGLAPHLHVDGLNNVADGPVEARRVVRQNLRFDVDFIKINATLTEHVRRYQGYCAPEMTADPMAAIFEEAHWHGRRVTAHCYGGPGATWAIEGGIDGIEHGFYLTDEQLAAMAERGTVLCPTLSVVGRFREMGQAALPPGQPHLEAWRKKAIAAAWDMVGRAKQQGVKIIAGTDAAMPYVRHGTTAYELEMLVEAGLTPMEAIVACTGGAAEAIDFQDVGAVKTGRFADLVFVDADPLADIRVLNQPEHIRAVIKGGKFIKGDPAASATAAPARKTA